jgi:predicted O-methyltransferase YrrM
VRVDSKRFNRGATLARRALTHPGWVLERARSRREQRRRAPAPFSLAEHSESVATEEEAARALLGLSPSEHATIATEAWLPEAQTGDRTQWRSRKPLLSLLWMVVRSVKPFVVVETGVEQGYSSAVILAALEANGRGELRSIDLPALDANPGEFTGRLVPERLRGRWDLNLGPSRVELPRLLSELERPVDVFLHDADHSYDSQMREYRTVWPHLRPGGLLISDDVWTHAFTDFASRVDRRPVLIARHADGDAIGLLAK